MKKTTVTRRALASVALAFAALGAAGCQVGYPHACDNHGGTRYVIKAVNVCRDGHKVGDGWLELHGKTVAP